MGINVNLSLLRDFIIITVSLSAYFIFRWYQEKVKKDNWLNQRKAREAVTDKKSYIIKAQEDALAAGVELSQFGVIGITLAGIVGGYLIVYAITGKSTLAVIGALGGLFVPKLWQKRMIDGRRKAFNLQLEKVLRKLASCLQAGMNFPQSLAESIQKIDDPAREIFIFTLQRIETGDSTTMALKEASRRVKSRDMEMFATAVSINEPLGGNLGAVLSKLEESLRDQRNYKEQLRAATSEGSLTAWVLAAMPFLFIGFLRWSAPDLMDPLFNTFTGNIIFLVSFIMIIIGVIQIKGMTNYDD